jgi:hypothetical protein
MPGKIIEKTPSLSNFLKLSVVYLNNYEQTIKYIRNEVNESVGNASLADISEKTSAN